MRHRGTRGRESQKRWNRRCGRRNERSGDAAQNKGHRDGKQKFQHLAVVMKANESIWGDGVASS
jgi:hypothetical protein